MTHSTNQSSLAQADATPVTASADDLATTYQQYLQHHTQALGFTSPPDADNITTEQLQSLREFEQAIALDEQRPIEPYAFIRVSNEALSVQQALESLVPFFRKGIIAYHDPLPGIATDQTLAIVKAFIAQHPGFKLCHYPFPVIYHNCLQLPEILADDRFCRYWLLDAYCSYALWYAMELIQENQDTERAYLCKIDMDHVYSQPAFYYMYHQMLNHPEDNAFMMYKFNVLQDHRKLQADSSGCWFHSLVQEYDFFCVRLATIAGFKFLAIQDPNYTPGSGLDFANYEMMLYRSTFKMNSLSYLSSFHLFREKYRLYSSTPVDQTAFYRTGIDYQRTDFEKLGNIAPEVRLDPEFFSLSHLQQIFQQLHYVDPEVMKQYDRNLFDVAQLLSNPAYQTEAIVARFNQRNGDIDAGKISATLSERQDILRESRVLSRLFQANSLLPIAHYQDIATAVGKAVK